MYWSSRTLHLIKWPVNKHTKRTSSRCAAEWFQRPYWTCLQEPVNFPDGCVTHNTWMSNIPHGMSGWLAHMSSLWKCWNSPALQFNEYFMLDQVWNPACISENRYSSAMNCLNPGCFATLTLAAPQRAVITSRVASATNHSLNHLHYWQCVYHKNITNIRSNYSGA